MNALTTNLVTNSRDYGIPYQTARGSFCPFRELTVKSSAISQDFLADLLTFSGNIDMWPSIEL